jgi:hypothetical protein
MRWVSELELQENTNLQSMYISPMERHLALVMGVMLVLGLRNAQVKKALS